MSLIYNRRPRAGLPAALPSHLFFFFFFPNPDGDPLRQVTIDDCTHVIDAGRVREMRYDPVTRMSCLVEVWISKV